VGEAEQAAAQARRRPAEDLGAMIVLDRVADWIVKFHLDGPDRPSDAATGKLAWNQ
jgi:hypothetical protein